MNTDKKRKEPTRVMAVLKLSSSKRVKRVLTTTLTFRMALSPIAGAEEGEGPRPGTKEVGEQIAGLPEKVKAVLVDMLGNEGQKIAALRDGEVSAARLSLFDSWKDAEPSYEAKHIAIEAIRIEAETKDGETMRWLSFRVKLVGGEIARWLGEREGKRVGDTIGLVIEE